MNKFSSLIQSQKILPKNKISKIYFKIRISEKLLKDHKKPFLSKKVKSQLHKEKLYNRRKQFPQGKKLRKFISPPIS
jgi:hypothetical protein